MLSEISVSELEASSPPVDSDGHYRAIIGMLVESILPSTPPASAAALRLRELAVDLRQPVDLSKLSDHRVALEGCVESFQEDLARLQQAVEQGIAGPPPDAATGLPGPTAAQQLISNRLNDGQPTFTAILVLDQLRALNARFGHAVGDQVLKLAAEGLIASLDGAGILHRWRGPAFLVVCTKGQQQADDLGERIRKLVAKRLETTISVQNRSIHIKITFTWHIDHVSSSADVLSRQLDEFVATRGTGGIKSQA